ncbi:hypothetical protein Z517_01054 [Fonsecaea pedrosoi CBS 271.37]|uniref:Heterokaryon incompatibility domain-containing protein n=1 Tax=Fonsecaea pedrosoi CBS 271.37 TaxID=1442368 RepID=A0A0D2FG16_9EURO|nr:uncharacterized protein Z517_01054 [Fonsecaea pedrosoi CBS 271.37]KIW85662.1 hypothetical protein Z517_01054 [Fonsecaea pedrosoi CBS 271.37]
MPSLRDAHFDCHVEGKGESNDKVADAAHTAAFLQEWLYLGLITSIFAICRVTFNGHDLIRYPSSFRRRKKKKNKNKNNRAFVTTTTLGAKLQQWYDQEKYASPSAKADHERDIRYNFTLVSGLLEAFNLRLRTAGNDAQATYLRNCLPGEIELSIVVLLATIQYFHTVIYDPPSSLPVPTCPWLSSLMVSEGWCVGQVSNLWRRHRNVLTMYYFKMLGPPTVQTDHSHCSNRRCIANNVLEDQYVTVHCPVEPSFMHFRVPKTITKRMSCRCGGHVGPSSEKLVAIIEQGSIPIISVRCPTAARNGKWDDSLDLDVIAYTGATPYVAISHVWSDGLGNPSANTLPFCQLRALRAQLQYMIFTNPEYFGSVFPTGSRIRKTARLERLYFWIDTLCVPVNNTEMREKAILDMRNVFAAASAVLVKDAELNAQSRYCPVEELMARVCVSPWCGRLWTLQEGALNDQVFVQTSHNEVVLLDDLNEPMRSLVLLSDELLDADSTDVFDRVPAALDGENNSPPEPWDFAAKFAACPSTILSMNVLPSNIGPRSILHHSKAELFLHVLTQIQGRDTSKASDEAICLATLLDVGMEDVLKEDTCENRWTAFLSVVEDVLSARIIFTTLPRMNRKGYHWAPRSFLNYVEGTELARIVNVDSFDPESHELDRDSDLDEPLPTQRVQRPVRISKGGLVVEFPGFTFQSLANALSPEFCFTAENGHATYWCMTEYSRPHFEAYFEGSVVLPEQSWDVVKPGPSSRLSLVLEDHFSDAAAPVRGALLTACSEEGNVVQGTYLCLVLVVRTTSSYRPPDFELTKEKLNQDAEHAQWDLAIDTKLGRREEREWCIA